jgi:hypothetical protein
LRTTSVFAAISPGRWRFGEASITKTPTIMSEEKYQRPQSRSARTRCLAIFFPDHRYPEEHLAGRLSPKTFEQGNVNHVENAQHKHEREQQHQNQD